MKAVFGLGNPGLDYGLTRHNVGFAMIDLYRKIYRHKGKGRIACSSLIYRVDNLLLVKPTTYMNASGESVRAVVDRFGIALSDVIIIYDDLDIPLGMMRILPRGGAGTHKGMLSILAAVETEAIPRLRVGIGGESRSEDTVDYVLSRFSEKEWQELYPVLQHGVAAVEAFCTCNIDEVMTRFNRRGMVDGRKAAAP